jgi:hypothetical protein
MITREKLERLICTGSPLMYVRPGYTRSSGYALAKVVREVLEQSPNTGKWVICCYDDEDYQSGEEIADYYTLEEVQARFYEIPGGWIGLYESQLIYNSVEILPISDGHWRKAKERW